MYNNRYHSKSSLEEASEAAAKVNAMLIAEGKLKLSQVNQHYQSKAKAGGLFVLDIDINDAPITCRNILTKGTTQEHIMKLSGAAISTRGRYIHPEEKSKVVADDKPLFLYIQATTQQAINIAAKRINEILKDGQGKPAWNENNNHLIHPPPPVPVNTIHQQPPPQTHQPPPTTYLRPPPNEPAMVTFLQEKLYIGLEHAPPNFDVKNKIIGPGGCYLRHVMGESGAIATLCGKGSSFGDADSIEPMHIQLQHPTMEGLQQAKALASNLIQTVQQEYAQFQQALAAMPQPMTPNQTPVYMEVPGQTSLQGGTLLGPPGIATITTLTQPLTGLPGMQPAQGMVGLPASSQAVSMTSSLPPTSMINVAQAMGSRPGSVMLPTSSSYTTMAITSPLVASPLPSVQMLSNIEGGNVSNENVLLVPNTSVPPPILQGPPPQTQQFEINNPNNQFIALPSDGQIIVSGTPQPGGNQVTVVGPPQAVIPQPGPLPAIITGPNGQTMELVQTSQGPPPQSIPIVGQGQPQPPPFSVQTSIPYSGEMLTSTASLTVSNPLTSTIQPFKEEGTGKRRFTEEKTDEVIPTNLLGYQHGPGWNNKSKSTVGDKSDEKKTLIGIKRGSQKSEDEPGQKKEKNSNGMHISKDYGYGDENLEKELKKGQKTDKDGKAQEEELQSLSNDGTIDPHVHAYKVTVSSAPTIYNTSQSVHPPSVSFGQYTQPPPDQAQYINAGPLGEPQMYPPPGQPLTLSSQSLPIHNPPVPVVSISVPMASQQMPVVSSHPMIPGQPIIASQHIPVFSQPPVPITSQALPAYSQAMPVSNQPYREPSPLAWGAPAPPPSSIAPPLPPTSFYQSNQPPLHQWNGPEPTYSTPSSQPGFTPGVFTGPPPTSMQYSQPPPPMPYWVGPN